LKSTGGIDHESSVARGGGNGVRDDWGMPSGDGANAGHDAAHNSGRGIGGVLHADPGGARHAAIDPRGAVTHASARGMRVRRDGQAEAVCVGKGWHPDTDSVQLRWDAAFLLSTENHRGRH